MPSLYEYYNTGDDAYSAFFGVQWAAQTFTVGATGHTVTSVKLKMYRVGSPGTVTVSIRATDASGHPTGGDLTSGTIDGNGFTTSTAGAWYEIGVTEYTLSPNTQYAIVVRAPSGNYPDNCVKNRLDTSSPTYTLGNYEESYDGGNSWTAYTTMDWMFEVWGNAGGVANYQTITDSLGLVDSAVPRGDYKQTVIEVLGLLDTVVARADYKQTILDLLGILDTVAPRSDYKQLIIDLLGLLDTVASKGEYKQTITDILGLLDSATAEIPTPPPTAPPGMGRPPPPKPPVLPEDVLQLIRRYLELKLGEKNA